MKKIPAVAYCRVSTRTDDQENSFEAQQNFFLTQAEKLGYELVKDYGENGIYADQGISGKSRKKRDKFNQMIKDAEKQDFQFILTTNLKRYARDVVTLQDTVRELRRYKVYVHFIKEDIKTNDFTEEVLMNILSVLAQNDLVDLSKNIQLGMRQAQRDGKWTSQPPFGYDRINAYLVINENESEVVKLIFRKYIDGLSLNRIAQFLNDNNIHTKKGSKWDGTGIGNILKNPIYYGKQICHQYETKDIFLNLQEKLDDYEYIEHQKEELIIISKEIFHQAQEILKTRAIMFDQGKRYSTENKLSNLFYCGNCGSTMKRFERTDNHKPFYLCRNHHNNKGCNHSNYAREDKTIEYIINEIKNFEFTWEIPDLADSEGYAPLGFESIKEMYERYIIDNLDDDLIDDLPSIQEKIVKLENRKNNLIDMRADGEISKEEYLQRRKQIEDQLDPLLREKKKISNLVQERDKVWRTYEQFCKNIKDFDVNNVTNIELRKIIKKIIIKTEGEERKIIIDWNNGLDKGFDKIIEEYIDNKNIDTYGQEDFIEIYDFDK